MPTYYVVGPIMGDAPGPIMVSPDSAVDGADPLAAARSYAEARSAGPGRYLVVDVTQLQPVDVAQTINYDVSAAE